LEIFEGNKGFMQTIAGPFEVDWTTKTFEGVTRSILKKYDAEIHSQPAIEGCLELRELHGFTGDQVRSVEVEIFEVAYSIIGGGEEGSKTEIQTKEEADHSLPYMIAAALLDGELGPEQYDSQRIRAADVQRLLREVRVRPNAQFTARFPAEMPTRVVITLHSGKSYETLKTDYEGFHTRPASWSMVSRKMRRLARNFAATEVLDRLESLVAHLEEFPIRKLTKLLSDLQGVRESYDP
jgi:2-methylcitrate dehydratase